MKLSELNIGEKARVESVGGTGALRQHFLDMGLIPGAVLTLVKFAPMGDPMEFRIHDYELTLRIAEAEEIEVQKAEATSEEAFASKENGKRIACAAGKTKIFRSARS